MSKPITPLAQPAGCTKALVLYDDLSSFTRANARLQRLAQAPRFVVPLAIKPCRLSMLRFPPTSEEALTEALDAQVIVFAGRQTGSYPFWLQDWLGLWAKRRRIEAAAIVVFGVAPAEESLFAGAFTLKKFVGSHGLSLIIEPAWDRENNPVMPVEPAPTFSWERYVGTRAW